MRGRVLRLRASGGGVATSGRLVLGRRVYPDLAQVLVERPEQHNDTHHQQERCYKRQEAWSTRKVSHVFYPSFVNYPASL